MLIPYETLFSGRSVSALDRDKSLVFREICSNPSATRKRLGASLGMRPTTVSHLVNELIGAGVVAETRAVAASGKGRPEMLLAPVRDRFVVVMLSVVSHDIRCALVDLSGTVMREDVVEFNRAEADNESIMAVVTDLIATLTRDIADHSEVLGIGVVVPGIIDPQRRHWVYAARWPLMRSLPFDRIAADLKLPVRVDRNLTLELRTRMLRKPEERQGGVLFVHWGYGIGSSFAWNGNVIESSVGSFGEFGHWTTDAHAGTRCHCGETDCLETVSSLWSLLPELRKSFPDVPTDETSFAEFVKSHDILKLPAVQRAVDAFALALANLNKAFFANRIVLSGPFLADPAILARLEQGFVNRLPDYARGKCDLHVAQQGAFDLTQGSTMPFFEDRMRKIFTTHDGNRK